MPIRSIKNALLLKWFCAPEKRPLSSHPRILVVTTTGLGDTLFATPAIESLRHHFPSSYLAALTSPVGKQVLTLNPHLNDLFVVSGPSFFSYLSLKKKMKKQEFELIFLFHFSQRLILPLCLQLHPNHLVGTESCNKGLDALLTDVVKYKKVHEVEKRMQQLALFFSPSFTPRPRLYLKEEEKKEASSFLSSLQLKSEQPILAIHPGAQDFYKCWPKEMFLELIYQIHKEFSVPILLTQGPKEEKLCEEIVQKAPFIKKLPLLPLRSLASLLTYVKVFITNDTGPMHLADALGVPVIALFSPTLPALCGPYKSTSATLLAKPPTCRPCLQRKCHLPFCLYQISPREVMIQLKKILSLSC